MSVFLIRIWDRPYGFNVVAIVAENKADALNIVADRYHSQHDSPSKRGYAEVRGTCDATLGSSCSFEFQE